MRVGMFCPYSLTVPGGVQAQVLGLAEEMRRRGHEVRVLGPCDGPPPTTYVTPLGNSLPTAANGSIAPLAPDPSAALRTIRAVRDEGFDVWHLHEPLAPGPTLTALTLHSRPIVGTFHAAGRSSSYRYLAPVLRRLVRRVDIAVAVSPDARDLVRGHLGGEYEVLFNGVSVPPPPEDPIDDGRPHLLFLGRHEERKGLEVLLRAVDRLDLESDRVGRPVLDIVGDGPDSARLRGEYSDPDRFRWHGRVSEEAKWRLLWQAEILCAPALRGESFGVVLLEGMASGATVVASDIDGYRNVATNDRDALLVPAGNADALAGALRTALTDHALRDRLRAAGRERASGFTMDTLADAYIDRYHRLIT
ncbi:MAG: glycosyltransferase family 1 protein [Actinobacteria bacterium]|nr:glycosyltransferase family 1 protein [Actinomycetota bacterium]